MGKKIEQIMEHVTQNIGWQIYSPNSRIPSVREMAKKMAISTFTVAQAYDSLVAQGVLTSIKGSGYFVAEPKTTTWLAKAPPTMTANVLDMSWLMQHMINQLPDERITSSGTMPQDWLYDKYQIAKTNKKVIQDLNYLSESNNLLGFTPLREQISTELMSLDIHAHPNEIMTTIGVSQGIELIVRAHCQFGDYVLIDEPNWYWITGYLQKLGIQPLGVPRDEHGVNIEVLEQLLKSFRPKLYITNSILHNPTSYNLPVNNMFSVLKLMETYQCYLVEDDIYRYFSDEKLMRYASLDGFNRVFYLTGVSKVLGKNWQVGFICVPKGQLEPLLKQKMFTNIANSALVERTTHHILQQLSFSKYKRQLQQRLSVAHKNLDNQLKRIGLTYPKHHTFSGIFAWINVGMDTRELALQAYKDNWLVAPSHLFNVNTPDNLHIRLNVTRVNNEFLDWLSNYRETYS